jgi:anti-repressor protein
MNNAIQTFTNANGYTLRTVTDNDTVYFVGKDVAEMLGYANTKDAIAKHCKGVAKRYPVQTAGGTQEVRVITEPDFYRLVVNSKLPAAQEYEKWVFEEVLPAIRKSGGYMVDIANETPEETMARALTIASETMERQKARIAALEAKTNEQQLELAQQDVTIKQQQLALDVAAPKALFADAVSQSDSCILIGELAKLLRQNGVDIGQNRLWKWMREQHYICKNSNNPTQKSMEKGLFRVVERTVMAGDGLTRAVFTTKVTGKGQQYFINLFLNSAV